MSPQAVQNSKSRAQARRCRVVVCVLLRLRYGAERAQRGAGRKKGRGGIQGKARRGFYASLGGARVRARVRLVSIWVR